MRPSAARKRRKSCPALRRRPRLGSFRSWLGNGQDCVPPFLRTCNSRAFVQRTVLLEANLLRWLRYRDFAQLWSRAAQPSDPRSIASSVTNQSASACAIRRISSPCRFKASLTMEPLRRAPLSETSLRSISSRSLERTAILPSIRRTSCRNGSRTRRSLAARCLAIRRSFVSSEWFAFVNPPG